MLTVLLPNPLQKVVFQHFDDTAKDQGTQNIYLYNFAVELIHIFCPHVTTYKYVKKNTQLFKKCDKNGWTKQ